MLPACGFRTFDGILVLILPRHSNASYVAVNKCVSVKISFFLASQIKFELNRIQQQIYSGESSVRVLREKPCREYQKIKNNLLHLFFTRPSKESPKYDVCSGWGTAKCLCFSYVRKIQFVYLFVERNIVLFQLKFIFLLKKI